MPDPVPAAPATADARQYGDPGEPRTAALPPPQPGSTRSRRSLRRWLRVVAVICLSAAVVSITAGVLGVTQLNTARRVVLDQLDPALLGMQELSTAVINQETGVRGFAATGNRDFLTPYQQGRQQEDAALAILRRLGAAQPRPELTTGLDQVLASARAWRADYADPTIAAVSASGLAGSGAPPPRRGRSWTARRCSPRRCATLTRSSPRLTL